MRRTLAIATTLTMGCASAMPIVQYAGIPEEQHVESRALPSAPDSDPIATDADWVIALPKGECTGQDGILLSPEKAVRAKQWQDQYRNLRNLYDLDRAVWKSHRTVYEERLKKANERVKDLTPSWWDANEGNIAMGAGFVVGVLATVAITYVTK